MTFNDEFIVKNILLKSSYFYATMFFGEKIYNYLFKKLPLIFSSLSSSSREPKTSANIKCLP